MCVFLQVHYKKGHNERKAKYTSLSDPPEVELARRVANQRSDVRNTHTHTITLVLQHTVKMLCS